MSTRTTAALTAASLTATAMSIAATALSNGPAKLAVISHSKCIAESALEGRPVYRRTRQVFEVADIGELQSRTEGRRVIDVIPLRQGRD